VLSVTDPYGRILGFLDRSAQSQRKFQQQNRVPEHTAEFRNLRGFCNCLHTGTSPVGGICEGSATVLTQEPTPGGGICEGSASVFTQEPPQWEESARVLQLSSHRNLPQEEESVRVLHLSSHRNLPQGEESARVLQLSSHRNLPQGGGICDGTKLLRYHSLLYTSQRALI
jgi:hypothetical protein